jgi:hypothetical protein
MGDCFPLYEVRFMERVAVIWKRALGSWLLALGKTTLIFGYWRK